MGGMKNKMKPMRGWRATIGCRPALAIQSLVGDHWSLASEQPRVRWAGPAGDQRSPAGCGLVT
jgi:hypothetical protein